MNRFRFIHRQIAEYLAGRRIATLLLHQSRALLGSGLGWQSGVAGPLRETAAFAATHNPEIARWVADADPEVVGLSDVADDELRRSATLKLLERFRRRELTDTLLVRDELPLAGLKYPGAAEDLRSVLRERGEGCEDILELAVKLATAWQVTSVHEDLADLVLDRTAPLHPRVSAGYVLIASGAREVKRRLRPLIAGSPEDPDEELKGVALRCCWPEDVGTAELLEAIGPWRERGFYGAYTSFLYLLDEAGFDAANDRVKGLVWAKSVMGSGRPSDPMFRIAQRIAHGAVREIDDPAVAEALAELVWESALKHKDSPLGPLPKDTLSTEIPESPSPLVNNVKARRILLGRLVVRADDDHNLWLAGYQTPGLVVREDFAWLLENACNAELLEREREGYAELARFLPMHVSHETVEAWLRFRECEPVKSKLNYPLFVGLDSDEAARAREHYAMELEHRTRKREEHRGQPRGESVLLLLEHAETKNPRFFFNLCDELTRAPGTDRHTFQRFLTKTPGWEAASPETRRRIVEVAKRLLAAPSDTPEECRDVPLNSILGGYIVAAWLLFDCDRSWLTALPPEWWERWCWYFLRESRPTLSGEPDEAKAVFIGLLHSRAPLSVRDELVRLSTESSPESRHLLTGLLDMLKAIPDHELDVRFAHLIRDARVDASSAWDVTRFLLHRNNDLGTSTCRACLEGTHECTGADVAIQVAAALLHEQTTDTWKLAISFLRDHGEFARRVLGRYASIEPGGGLRALPGRHAVTPGQVGDLLALLLEHYPPESDRKHTGAFSMTHADSAVLFRDHLIGWLGNQKTAEALDALKLLEQRFGAKYRWLRRPRSAVERAYPTVPLEPSSSGDHGVGAPGQFATTHPISGRCGRWNPRCNRWV